MDGDLVGGVFILILAIIPVCIGIAVLRTHLWDIGLVISRTLTYAVVTALLVGVYTGLVLLATHKPHVNHAYRFRGAVWISRGMSLPAAVIDTDPRSPAPSGDNKLPPAAATSPRGGGDPGGRNGPGICP